MWESRSKGKSLYFQDLKFTVKHNGETKQIVKGVSGKFNSGELTAIMGPSGAGKTSLLNILTGFQRSGTEGTIRCSGSKNVKKGALQYKKECCYILQDDQLAPFFTVEEIMNIAANLKLGNISDKAKKFLILDILETLGLSMCLTTRCLRLSGGQKKRLSIALELIDNPPIMFLDEPTTGLDSSSSTQCIQMLKKLAREGRTIVCTIHQPSASLFELFDHVFVMAEGYCVYQGASSNTVAYLSSVGFNCPQYHNPADYLLEVANGEYGNFTEVLAKAAQEKKWRKNVTIPKLELEDQNNYPTIGADEPIYESKEVRHQYTPPSEINKFLILLHRTFLQIYRDWTISHLKLFLHVLVGIFLGVFYQNAGQDGSKTINNVGFLIVSAVYLCYTSLMPAVLKFPSELAVLKKERFNNWYKLKTYYAAFLVSDIPIQIIFSLAYTTTSYLISSQPYELSRFLRVQGILSLVALTASSLGIVLGTLVNPINGTFLGAILTCLMLSVAGFLVIFTHMPKVMYALTYISYISFAMEGMVQALYGYDRAPLTCPEDVEYCHYRFPKRLLEEFGMEKENFWVDVAYLIGNFIVLRVLAFCTLRNKLSPQ
ncbi:ATP-binding cassette sub-family G member 1 isoform X2 [Aethina tumida]|uniref:ATP-binding cassette sub-family G member 1 isoform X2 n=1 Tax=Aethina tumida TaxID=116153 RepID=UPI00096B2C17|nr:ATP-binding cassette sub-family G member 1 isoform X2 [Aethina tumida]